MADRLVDLIVSTIGGILSYLIIQSVNVYVFGLSPPSISAYGVLDPSVVTVMSLYFLIIVVPTIRNYKRFTIKKSVIYATLSLYASIIISMWMGFFISQISNADAYQSYLGPLSNISFRSGFYSVLLISLCFWIFIAVIPIIEQKNIKSKG